MRDSDRRALVSFHSDNEARVSDFFDAYAAELPPDMSARFRAYGSQFTRRHARVTLSSLFKLFRAQCNKVIADVHKELGFEDEDEDAIRESIEDAAGFEFQKPTAPESAALVSTGQHKREVDLARFRSLSQRLSSDEKLEAVLPSWVFDPITTIDPLNNPISETELSNITDEAIKFMCKQYGQHNIGIGLARIYAAQIRKKVKIGNRGKKNVVLGKDRDLASSIVEKTRNRTYKSVRAFHTYTIDPPPTPSLTSIFPCAAPSLFAQGNYKRVLEIHPDELDEQVKSMYKSALGSSSCVMLSEDVDIKMEESDEAFPEPTPKKDRVIETVGGNKLVVRKSFVIYGEAGQRQPLGNNTNQPAGGAASSEALPPSPSLSRAAQAATILLNAKTAREEQAKAKAADAAARVATRAAKKSGVEHTVVLEAVAVSAKAHDELWEKRLVFADSVPQVALPAFDFNCQSTVGNLVLIPAKKYQSAAVTDAAGREDFLGWAGRLMGYENHRRKMKVKINGDAGFEHLAIHGSSVYAVAKLTRLS